MTAPHQPNQDEAFAPKQSFDFGLPSATPSAATREVRQFSLPSSVRLQTIIETSTYAPQIPEKSALRNSVGQASIVTLLMQHQEHQHHQQHMLKTASAPASPRLFPRAPRASSDSASTRTVAPPAYSWMPDVRAMSSYGNSSTHSGSISGSVLQNEKLAETLRQADDEARHSRHRNGRRKLWLMVLIAIAVLLIAGLAVGLGVGLTAIMKRGQQQADLAATSKDLNSSSSGGGDSADQKFPLGRYRITTSLKHRNTACTSDASTWTCYADAGNSSSSPVVFDWIISATAPSFATSHSGITANGGIPANLSISSNPSTGNDAFQQNMVFTKQSLIYISPTTSDSPSTSTSISNLTFANATGPRYTFNFVMTKLSTISLNNNSIPTTVRTLANRDGATPPSASSSASPQSTSQCSPTLNMATTTFTAVLYLSQPHESGVPSETTRDSSDALTKLPTWPYAVEILQSRESSGSDANSCAASVSTRDSHQDVNSSNGKCTCSWRNF